jgi:putative toxin-antitoxin system antitoxin component (TIGR02293 family)
MGNSSKSSPSNKGSKKPKPYVASTQNQVVQDLQVAYDGGIQKLSHIRHGVPYQTVEALSIKAELPVKRMLEYLGMPQTTYNKKKREGHLLSTRDTEVLLALYELFEYGLEVFNQDHKSFDNWLRKPNPSLAGHVPESLFDTFTGMQEVRNCLQIIDYGNYA